MTNQPIQTSHSPHRGDEIQKYTKPGYHAVCLQIVNRQQKEKGESKAKQSKVAVTKCLLSLPYFSLNLLSSMIGN